MYIPREFVDWACNPQNQTVHSACVPLHSLGETRVMFNFHLLIKTLATMPKRRRAQIDRYNDEQGHSSSQGTAVVTNVRHVQFAIAENGRPMYSSATHNVSAVMNLESSVPSDTSANPVMSDPSNIQNSDESATTSVLPDDGSPDWLDENDTPLQEQMIHDPPLKRTKTGKPRKRVCLLFIQSLFSCYS
jgi:hypothetical protein